MPSGGPVNPVERLPDVRRPAAPQAGELGRDQARSKQESRFKSEEEKKEDEKEAEKEEEEQKEGDTESELKHPGEPLKLEAVFDDGFALVSEDDEFELKFHVLNQVDYKAFRPARIRRLSTGFTFHGCGSTSRAN
jgi:hypothetical protein